MDVTNQNFLELLPEIAETIKECDFIAIDTELSGLLRERSVNMFDLPGERFARNIESSRGYFIMQFGLSCFTRTDCLRYNNKTYNFYIFPQPNGQYGDLNRTFSLQAHAIQFLSEHGFDFNKLFKHGVSYLTFQEKKVIIARLKSDNKARHKVELNSNGLPKFVPKSMVNDCQNWMKKTKKYIDDMKLASGQEGIGDRINSSCDSGGGDGKNAGSGDWLELRDCSSNHRRAIMRRLLECQPMFENLEIENKHDPEKNETFLAVRYIDKAMKEENQRNALVAAKGFLEILELVILNRKPIVGHNLALDLIQIINQFIEPLTDDYSSFKEICHSLFPHVYDTKFIAHSILDPETLTSNQSRLDHLYCQLRDSETFPKLRVEQTGESFDRNQVPHQAGYDAYMSGYCFIVLCAAFLKKNKKLKQLTNSTNDQQVSIAQEETIIDEFSNKIHLSYSYDFKYYDLGGDEDQPNRDHVFYIECPPTWCLEDIFQVFYPFGGVKVSWLGKNSALCALRDPSKTGAVLDKCRAAKTNHGSNYRIFDYETYLKSFKPKETSHADDSSSDVEFYDA